MKMIGDLRAIEDEPLQLETADTGTGSVDE